MIIENSIEDGIDFFPHGRFEFGGGDESRLRPATDPDGQQSVSFAGRDGSDADTSKSSRDICSGISWMRVLEVTLGESEIVVRYQKRAHNPLLVAAGSR